MMNTRYSQREPIATSLAAVQPLYSLTVFFITRLIDILLRSLVLLDIFQLPNIIAVDEPSRIATTKGAFLRRLAGRKKGNSSCVG